MSSIPALLLVGMKQHDGRALADQLVRGAEELSDLAPGVADNSRRARQLVAVQVELRLQVPDFQPALELCAPASVLRADTGQLQLRQPRLVCVEVVPDFIQLLSRTQEIDVAQVVVEPEPIGADDDPLRDLLAVA